MRDSSHSSLQLLFMSGPVVLCCLLTSTSLAGNHLLSTHKNPWKLVVTPLASCSSKKMLACLTVVSHFTCPGLPSPVFGHGYGLFKDITLLPTGSHACFSKTLAITPVRTSVDRHTFALPPASYLHNVQRVTKARDKAVRE